MSSLVGGPEVSERPKKTVRLVDLFSGAGGLSLGWMSLAPAVDVQLLAAVDSDPALEQVFAWNFPNTRFVRHAYGDPMSENVSVEVARLAGLATEDVDVVLAGPPCQPFSAAGKRTPDEGARLVFHVCDFVAALRPKVVLIENVPEFRWTYDGRLLGRTRVMLANSGYVTDVHLLSAVDFGVPQTRVRCFTLGIRKDLAESQVNGFLNRFVRPTHAYDPKRPENGWTQKDLLDRLPPAVSVEAAIGDLPPLEAGQGVQEAVLSCDPQSPYQGRLRDPQARLYNHVAVRHSAELVAALSALRPGETPQRLDGHGLRRKEYFRAAYARLHPHQPAPTMTTQTHNPGSGRFTHYRDNRVLTVREVARLQSFPDWFRFFGTQEIQRRHVGNAVPPLLAEAIAAALVPIVVA